MNSFTADIIVSIWNRPVETRNCLVTLIGHSPDCRIIIVDNGSDRDTERMLEEFAEMLDDRAVLLRNQVNQGYVRAVNMGLSRAEADFLVILRNTSIVTASWLDQLVGHAPNRRDAGIIVPRLLRSKPDKVKAKAPPATSPEADHGSMDAMLLSRGLYDAVGGFDEEMDGGLWCLRDLSRRALKAGFTTHRVNGSVVYYEKDIPLGSLERRNAALQRSIGLYRERWGEPGSFCVHMQKGAGLELLRERLDALLQGARLGWYFSVITHPSLYRELAHAGLDSLHENINFVAVPIFLESRAIDGALRGENPNQSEFVPVSGVDGIPFSSAIQGIPFKELQGMIFAARKEFYGT